MPVLAQQAALTMAYPKHRLVVISDGEHTESVFGDLFQEVLVIDHNEINLLAVDENTTVLFEGGTDLDPSYYKEPRGRFTQVSDKMRDAHESAMYHRCARAGASMIGICRGAQIICAFYGGSLIQHVHGHIHSSHDIRTADNRAMKAAADHHQMMFPWKLNNDQWKLIAWADTPRSTKYWDGFDKASIMPPDFREPEVVWFPNIKALAIQPHPEWMMLEDEFPQYCRDLVTEYIFEDIPA